MVSNAVWCSGVAAVLAVNVVIGVYIILAWREDEDGEAKGVPPVGRFAKAKQQ